MVFFSKKRAFTLTEVLITVIIIAVLATLALPMLLKTMEKTRVGEAITNLNLIRTGQKIYFLEYNQFAEYINDLNIQNPQDESSRYFDYDIESADEYGFLGRAERRDTAPEPYRDDWYKIDKNGTITSGNSPFY